MSFKIQGVGHTGITVVDLERGPGGTRSRSKSPSAVRGVATNPGQGPANPARRTETSTVDLPPLRGFQIRMVVSPTVARSAPP